MKTLTKPEAPSKKVTLRRQASFPFDWNNKKVALGVFLDWLKKTIPAHGKDVTLELVEDWDYYGNDCVTSLEVAWDEVVDNPDFERETEKYATKLKRWMKKCQK